MYDKLWEETRSELIKNHLKNKENPSQQDFTTASKKVSFHQVLDEMANKGYETLAPYDELSFPSPNPSKHTLREYLMTMKSRRFDDADKAPFVFESINRTDDGRVLFTFSKATMEEATTVLECLPMVIQHEMHLDPSCFLSFNFMKMCQGNYYNPLTRTGVTAVAACLEDEVKINKNIKHRIPQAIRKASAKEIEHLFKRKENKMFSFNDDSDLASIANSIASYKLPENNHQKHITQISNLQTLLQTHHLQDNKDEVISALSESSNLSFDSKASKNRYEIERRADQMAMKKVDSSVHQLKIKQGLTLMQSGSLTLEMARALELPYNEIVALHSSKCFSDTQPENHNFSTTDFKKGVNMEVVPQMEQQVTIDNIERLEEDPASIRLPASDDSSSQTPLRGSPNKLMAPGSQNAGDEP